MTTEEGAKIVIRLTAEEKRRYEEIAKAKGSRTGAARLAAIVRAEILLADGILNQ